MQALAEEKESQAALHEAQTAALHAEHRSALAADKVRSSSAAARPRLACVACHLGFRALLHTGAESACP